MNGRWVHARDLQPGDLVVDYSNDQTRYTNCDRQQRPEWDKVRWTITDISGTYIKAQWHGNANIQGGMIINLCSANTSYYFFIVSAAFANPTLAAQFCAYVKENLG